jgi:hypothetical protein
MDGYMVSRQRIKSFARPLRAAIAVIFLIFTSAQAAMVSAASAESAVRADQIQKLLAEPMVHGSHEHAHAGSPMRDGHKTGSQASHHAPDSTDKGCEVHCAPAYTMPVVCPSIAPAFARCFAPVLSASMPRGEYTVHIRPPRQLT